MNWWTEIVDQKKVKFTRLFIILETPNKSGSERERDSEKKKQINVDDYYQ